MKTSSQIGNFQSRWSNRSPILSVFLAVMTSWCASAVAQDKTAKEIVPAAPSSDQGLATHQPASGTLSPGVSDMLKLADAGVSKEVLKAYVESSTAARQLTATEIIALKKHSVPDDIVTLMLKQGAQVRAAVVQARNDAAIRALAARKRASGGFDPESYEYFQHYYLQPRALASAYRRLPPYRYPYFP